MVEEVCHVRSAGLVADFPTHKIMSTASNRISLKVEFGGGLELLFSNQRSHRVTIPSTVPADNNTSLTEGAAESVLVWFPEDNVWCNRTGRTME